MNFGHLADAFMKRELETIKQHIVRRQQSRYWLKLLQVPSFQQLTCSQKNIRFAKPEWYLTLQPYALIILKSIHWAAGHFWVSDNQHEDTRRNIRLVHLNEQGVEDFLYSCKTSECACSQNKDRNDLHCTRTSKQCPWEEALLIKLLNNTKPNMCVRAVAWLTITTHIPAPHQMDHLLITPTKDKESERILSVWSHAPVLQ